MGPLAPFLAGLATCDESNCLKAAVHVMVHGVAKRGLLQRACMMCTATPLCACLSGCMVAFDSV